MSEKEPIDRERIARIRNGEQGIGIVVYLDIPPDMVDDWLENEGWDVAILDRVSSIDIVNYLNHMEGRRALVANDDAGKALSWLLMAGEDRQAWVATLMEGLFRLKPESGKPDPVKGLALDTEQNRNEMRRLFEEYDFVYREGRVIKDPDSLSPTDAVGAVEQLLSERNENDL